MAHNHEVIGSKPVPRIIILRPFIEVGRQMLVTLNKLSFTGMAQRKARGAHNSEVTGSKPVPRIIILRPFTEAGNVLSVWRRG